MPLPVEPMTPKQALIGVSKMVSMTIQAFERVGAMSRSLTVDSILFSLFIFIFLYFSFLFTFLFLEQLGLRLIGHAVTSVTS